MQGTIGLARQRVILKRVKFNVEVRLAYFITILVRSHKLHQCSFECCAAAPCFTQTLRAFSRISSQLTLAKLVCSSIPPALVQLAPLPTPIPTPPRLQFPQQTLLWLSPLPLRLQGAEELSHNEHFLNVYCSKKASESIADFRGFCSVSPAEAHKELTAGTWLVCSCPCLPP